MIYVRLHGCSLASIDLVNAEVDSMGRVTESGGSVKIRASLRRAIAEKIQAELRQECDVREERRRELEFLEKGGDPLDFRLGDTTSFSVQSITSLTDHCPELYVTDDAKAGFAFTASLHCDSAESNGRPGAPSACEPNSADNLISFSGENCSTDGDKVYVYPNGKNATLIECPSQLDGSQNAKETRDEVIFGSGRKSYQRRDRSRLTRDSAQSSSLDVVLSRGGNGISMPSFHGDMDFKELVLDFDKQDHKIFSNGILVSTCANTDADCKRVPSDTQLGAELDIARAVKSTNDPIQGDPPDNVRDVVAMDSLIHDQQKLVPMVDVLKCLIEQSSEESESLRACEVAFAKSLESRHSMPIFPLVNHSSSGRTKLYNAANTDLKSSPNNGKNNGPDEKYLDSGSSCTQSIGFLDGNNDTEMFTHSRLEDKDSTEPSCIIYGSESVQVCQVIHEKKEIKADANFTHLNDECAILRQNHKQDGLLFKAGTESNGSASNLEKETENQNRNQDEVKDQIVVESADVDGSHEPEVEKKFNTSLAGTMNTKIEDVSSVGPKGSTGNVAIEIASPPGVTNIASARLTSSANLVPSMADEDLILEEARIIEAKHRMFAQFAVSSSSTSHRKKSQWDFVLEEMTWLANDFAQERLWKITAASQVCRQASFASYSRFHEQNIYRESKKVAHFMATSVVKFWKSLEHTNQEQKLQCCNNYSHALRDYAMRFQIHNNRVLHAEAPATPDRMSNPGIMNMPFSDHLLEENIFYDVLPGAIKKWRRSFEPHIKIEKAGCSKQDEAETSTFNTIEDFVSQNNVLREDEGETNTYYKSVSSRLFPKRRKFITKANGSKPFEVAADSQFVERMERNNGIWGKCPANNLNVSFPTKRVRTSNRQRVLVPFSVGTSARVQALTKVDSSSGGTCSFQNALHDGSHAPKNLKVESVEDFEKQLLYNSAELSTKSKKKKSKQMESAYEPRWHADSSYQNDQRDLTKKRPNSHQFESNGLFGQYNAKKQKIMRQPNDSSFDSSAQVGRSAPSTMASQNSNPIKLDKYFGSRDRVRNNKALKVPGQIDSGNESPWSSFEDQALIVLVHDLGPNWDLISDAINSTLQFKCIYRKSKECKERHKQLMDRPACDGVYSSEDSGSSQPYSSTMPGIPEGSARRLFQRLLGPMEENTLKSHFDKVIMIGQKLQCRRKQEPKQIQPPHGSHMVALTQVSPNNLNGGPILTPLDLCEDTASTADVLPLAYKGPHSGGMPFYNQSAATSSVLAATSSPTPVNPSVKDGRYVVSRLTSLSIEEKQRMQQYNKQMLSARNFSQTNISSPGTLQGNGAPITSSISRNSLIARPGFPGIALPSMLNSGSKVAMSSTSKNLYTGVDSGQGNNSSRPCDSLHMMQPVPEIQMPLSQGIPQFGVQIQMPSFTNHTDSPPLPSSYLPHNHHQRSQTISSHHSHLQGTNQAYAMRLAKGRPVLQQQYFQQQQQQFAIASPNNMMPYAPPLAQLPLSSSSSPQNSPRIAHQTSTAAALSPGSPVIALPQYQQPHQKSVNGVAQTANISVKNQIGKQRRQPQPQSNPQCHKKQRKSQSVMNNNMPIEPNMLNGLSTRPLKKGEVMATHSSQGQGSSSTSHVRSKKPSLHPKLHRNKAMLQGNESLSQMSNSSIMPTPPNGMRNVSQSNSSASRDSESMYDSGTSNRTLSYNSGLGQKNPSDDLPLKVHDINTKWQHQQQSVVQSQPPDSHGNKQPSISTTASVSAAETVNDKYMETT